MSPAHLVVADLPAQPWKNGAGLTRELALAPPGAAMDGFDWRISVARIDRDAPFSAFDGVDRCITLLRGAGMRLHSPDGRLEHRLIQAGVPFGFNGEASLAATLLDGPCDDLNVMVRRGRWRAEVESIATDATLAPADAGLVLAYAGAWLCDAAPGPLAPLQAWLWRDTMPTVCLEPAARQSRAVVVRLHRLCQDSA